MKNFSLAIVAVFFLLSQMAYANDDTVVVYSSRSEHLIKPMFDKFTAQTGINVEFLTGSSNALIERIKLEGNNTPADILLTVDAGNLWYAASQNILQPLNSTVINQNVPPHLRSADDFWTGLSIRARTIVYSTERVNPNELSTYEALAQPQFAGRLCLRTSKKIYTKSLVASMIYHLGEVKTKEIVQGWVDNLATAPNAKDSAVMDSILAGQCDVGLVNTYYFGRLTAKKPDVPLALFWANQQTTGTHVNVSGAGILKHAKHSQNAKQLIEWLSSDKAQGLFASLNKEYPVNPQVEPDPIVNAWGDFKQDRMNLSHAGKLQQQAVTLMQQVGYR